MAFSVSVVGINNRAQLEITLEFLPGDVRKVTTQLPPRRIDLTYCEALINDNYPEMYDRMTDSLRRQLLDQILK
jgi:hypothetical protein